VTGARWVMERDLMSVKDVEDFLWRSLLIGDFRRCGAAGDGVASVALVDARGGLDVVVSALGLSETAEQKDVLEDEVDASDDTALIGSNVAVVRDLAPNSSLRSSSTTRFKVFVVGRASVLPPTTPSSALTSCNDLLVATSESLPEPFVPNLSPARDALASGAPTRPTPRASSNERSLCNGTGVIVESRVATRSR